MRFLINLPIGTLLISLLFGCSGDKPTGPPPTDVFPQTVGSRWTYLFYPAGSDDRDTVDVEITSQSLGTQGLGTIWSVTSRLGGYGFQEDLFRGGDSYVVILGDSVHFYDERPGSPPYMTLLLPLSEGKHWDTPTPAMSDETTVAGKETFEVPAGVFQNAWRLERLLMWEDCGLDSEQWFVPDVGFIKSEAAIVGSVCFGGTSTWELLSYSIPNGE